MDVLTFKLGEEVLIKTKVKPENRNEIVNISSSEYKIYDEDDNLIASGETEIVNSNEIQVLYSASQRGTFRFEVSVKVGREKRIDDCKLIVR